MRPWQAEITFQDGRRHTTPDLRLANPGWGDLDPRRAIRSLDFKLPTGHLVRLAGFEAYNLFVEASQALGGGRDTRLEAVWLCGRKGRLVEMWRIGGGKVVRDLRAACGFAMRFQCHPPVLYCARESRLHAPPHVWRPCPCPIHRLPR